MLIELLGAGGLLIVVGLVLGVRTMHRIASERATSNTDGGTGSTDEVSESPKDETTQDTSSDAEPKPQQAETGAEAQPGAGTEANEGDEPAAQPLPKRSGDDESTPDSAATDRRVLGYIGAAANARSQAESAIDDGDYEVAEKRLRSAQSTLETAIDVDETHDLDRAADLQDRLERVEELLEEVERQREGGSNADSRVIGMLGSAASSVSFAETAIDEGDYALAETRLQSALSTYKTAADLDKAHNLGRGDDIQHRMGEVEDLLADVERQRDDAPTTAGEDPDDAVCTHNDRELTDVSGVLSADATALRAAGFESVDDLERASLEDLQAVEGIDPHVALRIKADIGG